MFHFYKLTATLTGFFLATKDDETGHTGYGHLGCCSLLIIQQVTDLSPKRTDVVIGAFNCETTVWKPDAKDVPELDLYEQCMSSCDQLKEAAIKSLAKHWNDDVTVSSGILSALITDTTGTDHLTWTSSDLSTSYAVVGKGKESPTFSVTREACQPIDGKNSSPRLISCDDFATTADWSPQSHREYERLIDDGKNVLAEKMLIDSAEGLSSKGDQSWRTKSLSIAAHTILIREIKHWGVLPILICDSVNAQNLTA